MTSSSAPRLERTRVVLDDRAVADLADRLARTRSAPDLGPGWERGVPRAWLDELVDDWRGFDVQAFQTQLDTLPHLRGVVGDQELHVVYVEGSGPQPVLLLLAQLPLSTLTLYWTTNTIASSLLPYWAYRHGNAALPVDSPSAVPTAVTIFGGERVPFPKPPRHLADRFYKVSAWAEHAIGGHFPAVAEPETLAEVLRDTLGARRSDPAPVYWGCNRSVTAPGESLSA